jgi:hypothetical protein
MLAIYNTPFYSFCFPLSNLFGIFRFELMVRNLQDQNYDVSVLHYSYRLHNFLAQIYHTFPFPTCFGLMGPFSGILGFYNRLFIFLLLSPHWPVFTHWEYVVCMVFICPVLRNVLLMGYLKYCRVFMVVTVDGVLD